MSRHVAIRLMAACWLIRGPFLLQSCVDTPHNWQYLYSIVQLGVRVKMPQGKVMGQVTTAILAPGRREANKRDKLVRIRRAARKIFLSKGFEAATVREVAAAADVAFGTVFLYAKDKQDLLFLLFEDDLTELSERAFLKVDRTTPFVDQLVTYFAEFYDFFTETPQLSRDMLREITFHAGLVATRLWAGVQSQERHIAELIAHGQAKGRINRSFDPDILAHIIFSLHRTQLRFCLDEAAPDVAKSLESLKRQLEVVFGQRRANVASASKARAMLLRVVDAPESATLQKLRLRA